MFKAAYASSGNAKKYTVLEMLIAINFVFFLLPEDGQAGGNML
jgi:hypothetical protein